MYRPVDSARFAIFVAGRKPKSRATDVRVTLTKHGINLKRLLRGLKGQKRTSCGGKYRRDRGDVMDRTDTRNAAPRVQDGRLET